MKRHHVLFIASILGIAIAASFVALWRNSPQKTAEQRFDDQVRNAVNGLNQPLRFLGRVVDQNDNPLAGVEISYKARTAVVPMFAALGSKDSYGKISTAADGVFYIDAGKGDMLRLFGFAKAGYRLAQNARTDFAYAGSPERHRPNAEHPVVFVMFQETAIEPLYHLDERFDLPCDGTPLVVDLVSAKRLPNGHLRVSLLRNPINISRGRPFEWSAKIEIVGGGLQRSGGGGAFIAPEKGYEPAVQYIFKPTQPDWDRGIRQAFYFRTADGKYGRLSLKLHADSRPPPAALFVESWLNPSGSRSLEPGRTAQPSP